MHPENKELPRYQCHMCKTNCAQTNILNHVWGRAHRIAYLVRHIYVQYVDSRHLHPLTDTHLLSFSNSIFLKYPFIASISSAAASTIFSSPEPKAHR